MLEGEIIKFYRKKAGLTQEQLGEGICSTTHVSKIERGQTAYSPEIITLFSERLQIDIEKEIEFVQGMKKQLHNWHNAIIMQRTKEIESTKEKLEKFSFIESSMYATLYQLLRARYFIMHNDLGQAHKLLQQVEKEYDQLSLYEKNLLQHVRGIYYISDYTNFTIENQQKAIEVLKTIRMDEYGNPEYYYHLAIAYHCIGVKVMAYLYADKALQHFKETNNFLRVINAESLMLLQIRGDMYLDFEETVERYHNLIDDSEALHDAEKKIMLLGNLGYEYHKRKEYISAQQCYKEALDMANKDHPSYLSHLYNYVHNAIEGNTLPRNELERMTKYGLAMANKLDNHFHQVVFELLMHQSKGDPERYYTFLQHTALPLFQSSKHVGMINEYGQALYQYYRQTEQHEKAVQIADIFMENIDM
ncbi:helix-turn-helix domain-containing protein [Ectobacillus sp. JY-23]|uniref:helix-turn-helix domain-containing protein n=1 Tax=Ectobacillus sp. JY-23 TaxID=2933872 RepID=UPI001FF3F5DE|nr:helix-turn-helix transcriptional regulator [Ectobacillus sp. JY-23]UOY91199.1 helix-turn-helix domain-containing protein [Ectobacillus sp. JY-23]